MTDSNVYPLPSLTWKANPIVAAAGRLALAPGLRGCKSFVFVATTGRSGSASLAEVLALGDGCRALHEPWPSMNDPRLVDRPIAGDTYSRRLYQWRKALWIRKEAQGCRHYIETSHLFIKSFCDQVFEDFGTSTQVIHLVRNPVKVATSMLALKTVPGSEAAAGWYFDWKSPHNLLKLQEIKGAEKLTSNPLALCLWYCYEIEARVAYWRSQQPAISFLDFHTEDLNNFDELSRLFAELHIECAPETIKNGLSVHRNRKQLKKSALDMTEAHASATHLALRECLEDAGVMPPTAFARYLID